MARRDVIEIRCDRCGRVATTSGDPGSPGDPIVLIYQGKELRFEDLCERCQRVVDDACQRITRKKDPPQTNKPAHLIS